ncbi:hypothetical protein HN011_008870 [Eciton burchellii]|nr:hypothetical protein HN011_008870 [Eciton burchellii]
MRYSRIALSPRASSWLIAPHIVLRKSRGGRGVAAETDGISRSSSSECRYRLVARSGVREISSPIGANQNANRYADATSMKRTRAGKMRAGSRSLRKCIFSGCRVIYLREYADDNNRRRGVRRSDEVYAS